MNKKFFNLLLMGALIVTTIGSVSSCKDYDDDINGLQEQINKLATASDLEAKVSELKGLISTNSSNISSLQTAVAKATTLDEVKEYIASCDFADKKYVTDAIKTLEDGDIANIKSTLQKVQDQLKEDGESLDDLDERLTAAEKTLKTLNETTHPNDMTAVNKKVTAIENDLAAVNKKVTAIENELKDIIGEYSTMVTDVQLYNLYAGVSGFDNKLNFIQTTELENVFPKNGETGTDKFTFTAGKDFIGEDSVIVRVSPVDAELTASNITLLNSQGKELTALINVTSVKRYTGLIAASRAAATNTGLWVIKFQPKSIGDDFVAAAVDKTTGEERSILYSVAVKNTMSNNSNRCVTSEYRLSLFTEIASHGFDFTVNNVSIQNIHNRYTMTEREYITTNDKVNHPDTYAEELNWLDDNRPFTAAITEGASKNAEDRYQSRDNRNSQNVLAVEAGKPIVIDFTKELGSYNNVNIKGFYVTLDTRFALESATSELNAWNSYEYVGVGYKDVPATLFRGNTGTIMVKDKNNVKGDIIGFRVYAVNYDGTLTDPDGRAFYVAVGDAVTEASITSAPVAVTYQSVDGEMLFASDFIAVNDLFDKDFDGVTSWKNITADDDNQKPLFSVKYYDADKQEIAAANIADRYTGRGKIQYVRYFLGSPTNFIDYTGNNGQVYTQSMTLTKSQASSTTTITTNVCKITASLKKVMPTEGPAFAYRTGFDKYEYIFPTDLKYTISESDPVANPKSGVTDLSQILIADKNTNLTGSDELKLDGIGEFLFTVKNGTYKLVAGDNYGVADLSVAAYDSPYKYPLVVANKKTTLVDNTTERDIIGQYTYKGISKRKIFTAGYPSFVTEDYTVPSASSEKIVYCSWTKSFSIDVTSRSTWVRNNSVTWSSTAGSTASLSFDKLGANVEDAARIKATATSLLQATDFGSLTTFDKYLTNKYLTIIESGSQYGQYAYTTDESGISFNPFFTVESINASGITLKQSNQSVVPPADGTKGIIHFKYADCFGNVFDAALPFVIKLP